VKHSEFNAAKLERIGIVTVLASFYSPSKIKYLVMSY
jgi:hypothetical protein